MSAVAEALRRTLPAHQVITDELRCLAYGTDASFYRLIPEVIAVVESENDLKSVLTAARASRRLTSPPIIPHPTRTLPASLPSS